MKRLLIAMLLALCLLNGCTKTNRSLTDTEIKTLVFQCLYYCSDNYSFEDCKKICLKD